MSAYRSLSPLVDRINDRYGRCAIGFGQFPPGVQGRHTCARDREILLPMDQHANTAYPLWLLRVPGERPRRRPAKRGDKRAPP
jgi:hypothetical protein